jgi:LysR family transcriptional activator of mexEF-oprN operon
VCLIDPEHTKLRHLREEDYFARDHVVVSYNADLRGIVEDMLHKQRRVRLSVPSFAKLGSLIAGTSLLATVPEHVAKYLRKVHPHLKTLPLPFKLPSGGSELLWPSTSDDDEPGRFLRDRIVAIAQRIA